jgi:putative PIN family toxin of toxin-antitoxin system
MPGSFWKGQIQIIDTNVLISAIVFRSKTMNKILETVLNEHKLVLSSCVIYELKQVVSRKFEGKSVALDEFLTVLPYEFVYAPDVMDKELFEIRDDMDYPVLHTAIVEDVDVLITGDKDFAGIAVEKPEIMSDPHYVKALKRSGKENSHM